jgi:hypothetical protein
LAQGLKKTKTPISAGRNPAPMNNMILTFRKIARGKLPETQFSEKNLFIQIFAEPKCAERHTFRRHILMHPDVSARKNCPPLRTYLFLINSRDTRCSRL